MCGITGYIDYKNHDGTEHLKKMVAALEHRGPDAEGHYVCKTKSEASVGLGHRRLSIIELSESGAQPMHFQNLSITFNGEIFNYAEIRSELQLLGAQFKSHSDTEVILQAYAKWGENCLEKFIGMFAFVIYDSQKESLFCARDRAGVKPFLYYQDENLFLFGSELKSFVTNPNFKKELNLHAVGAFIQFGNVPTPHCIYKNCYKLPPAHYLKFDIAKKEKQIVKYWNVYDAYNQPKLDLSFSDALNHTELLLKSAFRYRMVSDVPVGVFLSGGYDSACLTALLQKDQTQKLRTFTVGVPDIGLNEAPFAKEVAKYLGTDHTEIMCTQKEALEMIDDLAYYYDEPFADSSAIPTTLVCKMARQQLKVALSADGGDEIFAGYNRYDYMIKYQKTLASLPSFIRKSTFNFMNQVSAEKIPIFNKTYNFHNRYEKLKLLLRDPSAKNMMLSLSKQYDEPHTQELFIKKVLQMNTAYQSNELLEKYYTPLSYMMAIDYQTYLVDDILQKVDRASMSVGLEAREPYLDQRVIEWAARLPDDFKYHKGEKKYILKEIVHKHIPKSLMDRPKMGFAIPIENWLSTELKPKVEYYLGAERIAKQGIFKQDHVLNLKNDFFSGKKELAQKIWYLLTFQMWHEKWMDT